MSEKFTQWDSAQYLKTQADMAAYLDACMGEAGDDHAFIARARGMTRLAKDSGLSRESLYRALFGEGNPEFGTLLKVVQALGLKLHASVV